MPYGGMKDSGLVREGIQFAIGDMAEIRTLIVGTLPKPVVGNTSDPSTVSKL